MMSINDIKDTYRDRFGPNMANVLFQQHAMLSVNRYESWYIPEMDNKIEWAPAGARYLRRISGVWVRSTSSEDDNIDPNALSNVMKQIILTQVVVQPEDHWATMNNEQKQFMIKNFVQDYPSDLLPVDRFGDEDYVKTLLLLHSLWLGYGYDAEEFYNLYE